MGKRIPDEKYACFRSSAILKTKITLFPLYVSFDVCGVVVFIVFFKGEPVHI